MTHDIFISYAREDKDAALALCHFLEASGFSCWIAPRDITGDANNKGNFAAAIKAAIRNCRAMVIIFSGHANDSRYVQGEISMAFSRNIPLVPFRVHDVEPNDNLELYLVTSHWLDAFPPPVEKHFKNVIEYVRRILGPRSETTCRNEKCSPQSQLLPPSDAIPEIRTVTWQELEAHGIPTERIMRQCMRLDYGNIAGLDEASAGTIRQWRPIVENGRDGYSLLVDPSWHVLGYWHFLPLSQKLFSIACLGELEDVMITVEEVPVMGLPGFYDVYFVVVLVKPEHRSCKATRLLYEAFLEKLRYLSQQGIFVNSICTNAFSPEGLALCRTVGMQKLRNHKRVGEIYFLDANGVNSFIKRDSDLFKAYQQARDLK